MRPSRHEPSLAHRSLLLRQLTWRCRPRRAFLSPNPPMLKILLQESTVLLPHHLCIQCFANISMDSRALLLWMTIQYLYYFFCGSNCPSFGHWGSFSSVCVFLTCPHRAHPSTRPRRWRERAVGRQAAPGLGGLVSYLVTRTAGATPLRHCRLSVSRLDSAPSRCLLLLPASRSH